MCDNDIVDDMGKVVGFGDEGEIGIMVFVLVVYVIDCVIVMYLWVFFFVCFFKWVW